MDAAERAYQEEQARLRGETDDEDNLKIEIPKEPEVDPRVYRDVTSLLYRGFIHISVDINGVPLVLKSLNQHEFDLLQMSMGPNRTPANVNQRFYSIFLAYGVLMVDGNNILSDRDRWIPELADRFDRFNATVRKKMVWQLSEINRRATVAVMLTEAYAMEANSRFRWAQLRGMDIMSPSATGIRGTEYLGLNWAQLTWRALNLYEDARESIEREWENAKFIGACFAGKGISKVYNQDIRRRRDDLSAKRTRKDQILRHVVLGAPMDDNVLHKDGQVVIAAQTVDQLADQLSKSLKGEKDWHDEVVAAIEDRQQREYLEQQARLQALAEENEARYGGRGLIGATELGGLSIEDVAKRIEARQRAAARQVLPEMMDPKSSEFLNKWGLAGQGQPPPVVEAPNRESVKPFKR
jgi:hypothetical protein